MKKTVSFVLAAILLLSTLISFASCTQTQDNDSPEYISEEMREEHIANLIGDFELLAYNKKTVIVNEETGDSTTQYDWTVLPEYSTTVGSDFSTITDPATGSKLRRGITNMTLLCENDYFALYMDMGLVAVSSRYNTSDFALLDKTTGHVYHSNSTYESGSKYANVSPPKEGMTATSNYAVTDPIISQLAIEAYDVTNKRFEFNFRNNCLEDNRVEIVKMADNKFRIIYTIGNDPDKELVPPVITIETWAWIESKLLAITEVDDKGRNIGEEAIKDLTNNYKHVTPTSLAPEDKERFMRNYPLLDAIPMYIVRSLNTRQKQMVREAMTLAGFTVEMLKREMELVEYSGPERAVMFTIPLDLTLTEEGLTVNIDSSLIQAPAKQKMYKITLLRSFGSFTPVSNLPDVPYIITCDGSGAIMPAKGNVTQSVFTARIYGNDLTFQKNEEQTKLMQIISPFLMFDRGSAGGFMAILESGTAQAFATARPANVTSNPGASINYDLVYSERDYRTYSGGQANASSSLGDTSGSGVVLSKEKQVANFQVSYYFNEGNLTYSDYAELYRTYLLNKGTLSAEKLSSDTKTPFYLEVFGAINRLESVAGFPMDVIKALTSYTELKEIVELLSSNGVNNINVKYLYWTNEGYYNTITDTPALMKEMGTKAELSELVSYLQSKNIGFYPSAEFMYIYKDKAFDSLNFTSDVARRLDMRVARVYPRQLSTGTTIEFNTYNKVILSPDLVPTLAASYKAEFEKIVNNKQISFGSMGAELNSNYKVGRIINRTQALEAQIEAIELFANDGYQMLFTVGNDYVWKYADHITNLPIGASEYLSTTGSIPFIQMVLHGYISYASNAFNISADYETQFLQCLETGSGVIFRWMYDENDVFDFTEFTDFYSLNYKDSFDRAVALYKDVAAVLDRVTTDPITLHETATAYLVLDLDGPIPMLQEGDEGYVEGVETPAITRTKTTNVFRVIYGNGKLELYINYNSYDVELEDRSVVPARGYLEVK